MFVIYILTFIKRVRWGAPSNAFKVGVPDLALSPPEDGNALEGTIYAKTNLNKYWNHVTIPKPPYYAVKLPADKPMNILFDHRKCRIVKVHIDSLQCETASVTMQEGFFEEFEVL